MLKSVNSGSNGFFYNSRNVKNSLDDVNKNVYPSSAHKYQ